MVEVHGFRDRRWRRVERSPRLPALDLTLLVSFLDRPTVIEAMRDFRAALQAGR